MSVVSDPRLNTRSEDIVIESILRWVHSDAGQVSDNLEIEKKKKIEGDKHHASIHPSSGKNGTFVQGNGGAQWKLSILAIMIEATQQNVFLLGTVSQQKLKV